jgi:hypothetical protein
VRQVREYLAFANARAVLSAALARAADAVRRACRTQLNGGLLEAGCRARSRCRALALRRS